MIRVLVTDDSRVMRQIVIRTLRQAGYDWDVREASDGAEALAAIQADEPDVVLSDWNMPNMTGIELLRNLRAAGYQTPFGFVTSEGSPEMRSTAQEAGALFLIAKPFTAEGFREVIDPVLA
ncbi:response regulator [Cellulomonas rhizosphaerae]|uniref:response regulator n=1 Tax=Cellulomonas rhizosphaerae TaxID=2293719 RepID=UPI0018F5C317|nr:response regulator [Cellulomonas rhizosphaerae]